MGFGIYSRAYYLEGKTRCGLIWKLDKQIVSRHKMKPEDFDKELGALIDSWCERRELRLLRTLLPAYPRVSGLTDEWGHLATALKTIRAQHQKSLVNDELDRVIELLHIAEAIVYR